MSRREVLRAVEFDPEGFLRLVYEDGIKVTGIAKAPQVLIIPRTRDYVDQVDDLHDHLQAALHTLLDSYEATPFDDTAADDEGEEGDDSAYYAPYEDSIERSLQPPTPLTRTIRR